MPLQMLRTTILLLFLMTTSCTNNPTVEFLGFDGCPNTPVLRERLVTALPHMNIVDVDLMALQEGDPRLGWGAPTILVAGKDLFHTLPGGKHVSCRAWADGLPTADEIRNAFESENDE